MNPKIAQRMQHLAGFGRRGAAALLILTLALGLAACHRKTPEEMLTEASDLFRNRDIIGAEIKYEKILKQNPEGQYALAARHGLAVCYMADNQFDRGREEIDTLIKAVGPTTPDGLQFLYMKLNSFIVEKKPEKAIAEAQNTSSTMHAAPPEVRQQFQMMTAAVYTAAGKPDKANETYRQVIHDWPAIPELHMAALEGMVGEFQKKKQFDKAIAVYQEYLNTHPATKLKAELHFGIGFFQKQLGQPDKANASFDASEAELRQQIDKAMGAEAKGALLLKLTKVQQGRGNSAAANQTLERIAKEFPTHEMAIVARFNQAQLAMEAGKPADAISVLEGIIKGHPGTKYSSDANQWIQAIKAQSMKPTSGTLAMGRAAQTTQTTQTVRSAPVAPTTATAAKAAPAPKAAPAAATPATAPKAAAPAPGKAK
jgi:outer membrane protein assembly factor BamD (BamD/ComL family)